MAIGRRCLVFELGRVDDEQPAGDGHLNGRQADTGRVVHGFQHVGDELAEPRVEGLDGLARLPEQGVRHLDDLELRHAT